MALVEPAKVTPQPSAALFGRLERLAVRGEELQALLMRIAEDHRRLG